MRKLTITFAVACVSFLSGIVVLTLTAQDAGPAAASNCLSIPACEFQEHRSSYSYSRDLHMYATDSISNWYNAPVHLPHGATIRKLILFCKDNSKSTSIDLYMYRLNRDDVVVDLALISSTGANSSFRSFATTAISPRFVNNFKNCYLLTLRLPGTQTDGFEFSQAKILYDAP